MAVRSRRFDRQRATADRAKFLGFLAAPAALATFGVAWRLGGLVRMLPQAALAAALPVLSQEARRGASSALRTRFDRTLLAFSLASAPIVIRARLAARARTDGENFAVPSQPLVWYGIWLGAQLATVGGKVYFYISGFEALAVGGMLSRSCFRRRFV